MSVDNKGKKDGINVDVNVSVNIENVALTDREIQAVKDYAGSGAVKTLQSLELDGYPTVVAIAKGSAEIVEAFPNVKEDEITLSVANKVIDGTPTEVFSLGYYVDATESEFLEKHLTLALEKKKKNVAEFIKLQEKLFA